MICSPSLIATPRPTHASRLHDIEELDSFAWEDSIEELSETRPVLSVSADEQGAHEIDVMSIVATRGQPLVKE